MCKASPETATALCVRCPPATKLSFPHSIFSPVSLSQSTPNFTAESILWSENILLRKSGMIAGIDPEFYVSMGHLAVSLLEVKNSYLKDDKLSLHWLN